MKHIIAPAIPHIVEPFNLVDIKRTNYTWETEDRDICLSHLQIHPTDLDRFAKQSVEMCVFAANMSQIHDEDSLNQIMDKVDPKIKEIVSREIKNVKLLGKWQY